MYAAKLSRDPAAADKPEGVALSVGSCGRLITERRLSSESSAVSKKPPDGRAKWVTTTSTNCSANESHSRVAGRRDECVQTLGEVGVVLEDTRMLTHAPLARDSGEPAVIVEMDADEQIGALHRCLDPIRALQQGPGVGERGDRQAVPRSHHLVVADGLRAGQAGGQQPDSQRPPAIGVFGVMTQLQRRGTMLERSGRCDAQQSCGPVAVVGSQDLHQLGRRPDVGCALDGSAVDLRVGVEGAREPALRGSQVTQ